MSYIDPDQLHGALDGLITFTGKNAAAITAGDLDPVGVTTKLTAIRDGLKGTKDIRDGIRTELTTAQQAFAGAAATNYTAFSSLVDAISGALGKTTPLAHQALNYRMHLNIPAQHRTPAPVPPVTV